MMRRTLLILSALALSSGAAVADRFHGGHAGGGSSHVSSGSHFSHGGGGGGFVNRGGGSRFVDRGGSRFVGHSGGGFERDHRVYNGGGRVYNNYGRGYDRGYRTWSPGTRWDRSYYRNYYYSGGYYRPYLGVHYYDYYRRPALIIENYSPMAGYYWVPGSWQWDGAEWIWYPGHYEANAVVYGY